MATLALVDMVVVGQMYVTIPLMPQIGAAWHTSQGTATWATSAFTLAYALGVPDERPQVEPLWRTRGHSRKHRRDGIGAGAQLPSLLADLAVLIAGIIGNRRCDHLDFDQAVARKHAIYLAD